MEDDIPASSATPMRRRRAFYKETNRRCSSNRDGKPLYDFNLVVPERSSYKWLGEWARTSLTGINSERNGGIVLIFSVSVAQMLKTTTACSIPCLRGIYQKACNNVYKLHICRLGLVKFVFFNTFFFWQIILFSPISSLDTRWTYEG